MNRAAERLFGRYREQFNGQDVRSLVHLNDPALDWAQIRASKGVKTTQFKGPRGVFDAEFRVANFKTGDTQGVPCLSTTSPSANTPKRAFATWPPTTT